MFSAAGPVSPGVLRAPNSVSFLLLRAFAATGGSHASLSLPRWAVLDIGGCRHLCYNHGFTIELTVNNAISQTATSTGSLTTQVP